MQIPTEAKRLERSLYRLTMFDQFLSKKPSAEAPRYSARARTVDSLWEHAPFPSQQEAVPVLSIDPDEVDYARFVELTNNYTTPVVIRGFGKNTQAVQQWTPVSLAERLQDAPCVVVEMDDASRDESHSSGRILHKMPFDEFVSRMEDEPLYLHNSTEFVEMCPELLEELELHTINQAFTTPDSDWDELFSSNLFVGSELVYSNIHCAPGGNFFLQIAGKKHWTLVAPEYSPYLFPILSKPFNHCLSVFGSYRKYKKSGQDSPIFRLPRLEVTLEPGDLLYNPPWWWHEVENTGSTIGCALRHVPRPWKGSPTWNNHPLFSATSVYPQLWALSVWDFMRFRMGKKGSMRDFVNPRVASELNKARKR